MALIAAADIGRYAALRLAALDFPRFEVVNLIGPDLVTMADATRAIGKVVLKPQLPYVQLSYEDAEQGMIEAGLKPKLVKLYIELYQGAAQGLLRPQEGTGVVSTETTFAEFARTVFVGAYRQAAAA